MVPKKISGPKPDPADANPDDFSLTREEAQATADAVPATIAEAKPSAVSESGTITVSEAEARRLLSITDPTTGDASTSGADPIGANSPYTWVGWTDDGQVILNRTGVHPTR
jgi:hypothetical protein